MQNSKVKLSKKPKKKTKSKQKLEESLKNERIKEKDNKNKTIEEIKENSYISKLNQNNISITDNFSERNDLKDELENKKMYNTLQNSCYYNYYTNLSKTYNNDYYQNCFDVFNLKKRAANFRDIINNKSNNSLKAFNTNNFNNYLLLSKYSIAKNDYLKTQSYTNFYPKKYKSFIKESKLREEIEKINNTNKTDLFFRNYSTINQRNNEIKNLLNEKDEITKSNKDTTNNKVNIKNDNIIDDNNNDSKYITYHFFDKNMQIPKRAKKFFNSSKNKNKNNLNKTEIEQIEPIIKNKIKNKKNVFRKTSNNLNINNNNLNLNNYRINLNKINSIAYEDIKLNNLLRKIPSNKGFKNKSYDLIDYILKLRKNNKRNLFNRSINEINNNLQSIYPVNDCKAFIK